MKKILALTLISSLVLVGCDSVTLKNNANSVVNNANGEAYDVKSFGNKVYTDSNFIRFPKITNDNMNIVKNSGPIKVTLNAVRLSEIYIIDNKDLAKYNLENGKTYTLVQVKLDINNTSENVINFHLNNAKLKTNNGNIYQNTVYIKDYTYPGNHGNSVNLEFLLKNDDIDNIKTMTLTTSVGATDSRGSIISGAEPLHIVLNVPR